MWNPFLRRTRRSLLKHAIDLLERQTLGLRHQEVSKKNAGSACSAPDEENLGFHIPVGLIDHVGGDEADDKIPEPLSTLAFESESFENTYYLHY
jgi:hypothetical protein